MSRLISNIYSMKKNIYIITTEIKTERLDTFISLKCSLTRSFIQKLIREGSVTVNSRKEKSSYRIKTDDQIEVNIPDEPEGTLIPEDLPLDIISEDEHIVVVNKPPHMVIYPAAGNKSGTLMNALVSGGRKLASIGAPLRPGVVHRLDKDTSGLIIIAKDNNAYYGLVKQFRERQIEKRYLALLYGSLRENHGEIRTLIGRSASDRKKMSTRTKRGREAVTHYQVMRRFKSATLAGISILTGRTHQIRVHFASIGHPVLGDRTYGKKTNIRQGQKLITFPRQMLHAHILRLQHPVSGKTLEFTAPMPGDMEKVIGELKNNTD